MEDILLKQKVENHRVSRCDQTSHLSPFSAINLLTYEYKTNLWNTMLVSLLSVAALFLIRAEHNSNGIKASKLPKARGFENPKFHSVI